MAGDADVAPRERVCVGSTEIINKKIIFYQYFMSERIDPYFEDRLRTAQAHRVLRSVEVKASGPEVE